MGQARTSRKTRPKTKRGLWGCPVSLTLAGHIQSPSAKQTVWCKPHTAPEEDKRQGMNGQRPTRGTSNERRACVCHRGGPRAGCRTGHRTGPAGPLARASASSTPHRTWWSQQAAFETISRHAILGTKSSQSLVIKLNGLGRSHQRAQAPPALHREPGAASKQLQTHAVKLYALGQALLPKKALGKRSWAHPACTGGGKRVQQPRSSQRKLLQDTGQAYDECRESSECGAQ